MKSQKREVERQKLEVGVALTNEPVLMQEPLMPRYASDLRLRCRRFAADVISLCGEMSEKPGTRDIAGQVIRSASSIGANIEEARGSGTRLEFGRFFRIALKSANETRYWLELIQDVGLASNERIAKLLEEAKQISNMLGAAVLKLQNKSGKL